MVVKCEICGKEMKDRINGSHLKRKHNITIQEYTKKFPSAELGKYVVSDFKCELCGELTKGNSEIKRKHLLKHGLTIHEYNKIVNEPNRCKCGCGEYTEYSEKISKFLDYIDGHIPAWNVGLTKDTDERIKQMNSGGWNRGLTKETDYRIEKHAKLVSNMWNDTEKKRNMIKNVKRTMLEKYGVENANDYVDFWAKYYEYKLPSGSVVKVQGYENKGLDFLFECGIREDDIVVSRKKLPRFKWAHNKTYTPDILDVNTNTVYEIKSTWTYRIFKNKEEKIKSVLNSGFNYTILIFDNKQLIKKYEYIK